MKGLLIKDLYLISRRKTSLLLFAAAAVMIIISVGRELSIGYCAYLGLSLALCTIAYDKEGNGISFLLTLPVERRTYVLSKYLLCVICMSAELIFCAIVSAAVDLINGNTMSAGYTLVAGAVYMVVGILNADITIPVSLRYGPEITKLAYLVIYGVFVGVGVLITNTFGDVDWKVILDAVTGLGIGLVAALAIGVGVCLTLLSIRISENVLIKCEN